MNRVVSAFQAHPIPTTGVRVSARLSLFLQSISGRYGRGRIDPLGVRLSLLHPRTNDNCKKKGTYERIEECGIPLLLLLFKCDIA